MPMDTPRAARMIGITALAALAAACLLVLRPFMSALLWAVILVFSTWPVFTFVCQRARLSRGVGAVLMVAVLFLLIGLPIVLAAPTSREEVDILARRVIAVVSEPYHLVHNTVSVGVSVGIAIAPAAAGGAIAAP